MVREGWKCSESVWRGSSICHEYWNMHPEPGVAHHQKVAVKAKSFAYSVCHVTLVPGGSSHFKQAGILGWTHARVSGGSSFIYDESQS